MAILKRLARIAIFGPLLAFLGPKWAFAGDIVVSNFGAGLDTLDTPAEIPPNAAQDILNVNIQPGGASIFKRDGYGLFQTLGSTRAIHGGYHFQQVGGNDVQLWGSSTTLYSSVNDASFVAIATGTQDATWQCADSQGSAYCLTSGKDTCVKTDGSSANTSYQTGVPLGTMLAFTPTQLVVAGVSGNENTVYVSQQNAFTTFTVGVLPGSAFTEPIASPGSRITHLAYYFGKLFWWKDQSFGYATFTNQFDWQLTIVSNQIGTLDNSDAFWNSSGFDSGAKFTGVAAAQAGQSPGGIFFRGQDNHFYVYDGYYLTRISRPITPTVIAANRKKANSWAQTSQSDFSNGISSQTFALSTLILPGSVVLSTDQFSDSAWSSGTLVNVDTTTQFPGVILSSFSTVSTPANQSQLTNNGSADQSYIGLPASVNWMAQSFTTDGNAQQITTAKMFLGSTGGGCNTTFRLKSNNSGSPGTDILTSSISGSALTASGAWFTISLTPTTLSPNTVYWFYIDGCGHESGNITDISDNWFFATGNPYANGQAKHQTNNGGFVFDGTQDFEFEADMVGVTSFQYFSSGTVTSRLFDITLTSNTFYGGATYYAYLNSAETDNGQSITYGYQTSTGTVGNGPYVWTSSVTISTNTSFGPITSRYYRYVAQLNSTNPSLTPLLSGVTTHFTISTGTYYSAVGNAPNLSSWGNFSTNDISPGISSITYYTRASTNSFTILSSTPSWILQSKNAIVTASTGTYMQMRADFGVTAATETPTLNDFTFNWFEGSASDKAYMTYFNDAIWFSVSASSSVSTNNRIFYWDLLNGAWSIYDIPANGFQIENNALYFGSPTGPSVFKFGGVTTDNSLPINSYWRSKTFFAPSVLNPYNPPSFEDAMVQKEFIQADFVLGESSTTLSYTYTLDSKTSTVFLMTAFDSSASLIQRNFLLPVGKIGKYYDFKIGDNSSAAPWRLMAHRVHYNGLNWKPVLQ